MTVALVSSSCDCVVNQETAVVVSGQTTIGTSILYNKNDLMQLKPLRLLAASLALALLRYYLKKNQNAPRPSEHAPVRGKKCQNA